ncbi:tripartite tricarboxylate transporter permease [Pararhodobacter oceanensis]|uniref:C4-dicarboxylate ABC transporter permease n=1 Tax=Pararhodobacter oceanensis TaxID=2172121 RepID=A0A2T8HPN8_9RHOB|nr:tripartite tricarboxylate transporter permease [Pararhodobacter oceanensis]PVH27252.1 C4-dicarboxylate ABC transporter permease [Pararhodobacter oceanensis]
MIFELFLQTLLEYSTSPFMLGLALTGVGIGIVLGALPGVSSTMALAILLPVSFGLEPGAAMLFLITVFVSSVYGGSISAILINIPGTPGAIVTQFDGYPMAQKGKAGHALSYALLSSTAGGLIGLTLLITLSPAVAQAAMSFRSPEFAMATVFGLVLLSFASGSSTFRGILVAAVGVILGMVGFDPLTDIGRFDFDTRALQSGIELVPVTVGIFGLAEVLRNLADGRQSLPPVPHIGRIFPSLGEIINQWKPVARGGVIGTFVGAIPAAGSAIAVALTYAQEKRLSRTPDNFGKGEPAGISGPESANSASVGGSLVPMMTLGIPGDPVTAVLMGALLIHGLRPGPMLFVNNPGFVAGVYVAVFIGVILTLVVGFGLMRVVAQIMRIPRALLFCTIAILCMVGAFAIRNSLTDVYVMLFFGVLGYIMFLLRLPPAPLVFGLILGPILEENLRRTLILSRGSWTVFIERPISLALIIMSLIAIFAPALTSLWERRSRHKM